MATMAMRRPDRRPTREQQDARAVLRTREGDVTISGRAAVIVADIALQQQAINERRVGRVVAHFAHGQTTIEVVEQFPSIRLGGRGGDGVGTVLTREAIESEIALLQRILSALS